MESNITFQKETYSEAVEDIKSLIGEHYEEVSQHKDFPLQPSFDIYEKLDSIGMLSIFTARDEGKVIVGYAVFIVAKEHKYKDMLKATQDVLFIRKDIRGRGLDFLIYTQNELKEMGVKIVTQSVTPDNDFSKVLLWLGYKHTETIYTKNLTLKKGE